MKQLNLQNYLSLCARHFLSSSRGLGVNVSIPTQHIFRAPERQWMNCLQHLEELENTFSTLSSRQVPIYCQLPLGFLLETIKSLFQEHKCGREKSWGLEGKEVRGRTQISKKGRRKEQHVKVSEDRGCVSITSTQSIGWRKLDPKLWLSQRLACPLWLRGQVSARVWVWISQGTNF